LSEQIETVKKSAVVRRVQPAVVRAEVLQAAIDTAFPKFPLNDHLKNRLHEVAVAAITSLPYGAPTGLVFAGYGTNDLVPSLVEYLVAGFADGYLHVHKQREVKVVDTDSCVIPFAQSDVVATFMNGVAPDYLQTVLTTVRKVIGSYPKVLLDRVAASVELTGEQRKAIERDLRGIGRALNRRMRGVIERFQEEEFSGPVLQMVAGSSKSELASIAESLVFLTSLRRQFSTDEESVGGPIDVAVISRGDGFVWIKRKHYFSGDINPQFMRTYFEDADHA
jgi:hypothetical protein